MIPAMPNLSLSSSESTRTDSTARQGSGGQGGGGVRGVLQNIATGSARLSAETTADAGGIPVWVWVAMAGGAIALVWAFVTRRRA